MKPYIIPVLALGLLVNSGLAQDKPDLTNSKQKTSYAIGLDVVTTVKRLGFEVDPKALMAGISDGFAGKPALTEEERKAVITDLHNQAVAKEEEKEKAAAVINLKAGEAFLAANAKKAGVITTASGLQYKVIKSGTGPSPKLTDVVRVNYTGSLVDGTVFASSDKSGGPAVWHVQNMMPGWQEALQLMKVGDKWQLFVPAKLAYGEAGHDPIGPNSTLLFEAELLSIEKPAPAH